jgi:hypothetical protein
MVKTTHPIERDNVTLLELSNTSEPSLTDKIKESVKAFYSFNRQATAELRTKVLPLFDAAFELIKKGEAVNDCKTIKKFCESVEVKPGTIRQWRMRVKQEEASDAKQPVQEHPAKQEGQTLKGVLSASKQLMKDIDTIKTGLSDVDRHTLSEQLWRRGSELLSISKELSTHPIQQAA